MERREFIATFGAAAASASASAAFAQAQSPGAAIAKAHSHPAAYKALQESAGHCVRTGNDCLRHCFGMLSMNDTSMAGCTKAAHDLVAGCAALETLAATNSVYTAVLAKAVGDICEACQRECEKFSEVAECEACGDACKTCAKECRKLGV